MTPPLRDRMGHFYVIDLESTPDCHTVKLGWAADLTHRLNEHRKDRNAPTARVIESWPCLKGWEYPAIAVSRTLAKRQTGKETFVYVDVAPLLERLDGFFNEADRCSDPPPPTRPAVSRPVSDMLTVGQVVKQFGIPQSTVYYLVRIGKIPAHDVTQPWHRQRQHRFKLSEVQAALDRMQPGQPPADAR